MKNINIKSQKGFTIIEVVLVLAVAGLIFLMVFVALPNLQITQRDTQRKDALDKLSSKLSTYVANNNRMPSVASKDRTLVSVGDGGVTATGGDVWDNFIRNYLLAYDGTTAADTFEDPNGFPYSIYVFNGTEGATAASHLDHFEGNEGGRGATFVIGYGLSCADSDLDTQAFTKKGNDGKRSYAVAVMTEGSGVACVDGN